MLLRHLNDADFFDLSNPPQATFIAERAERLDACTEGTPNFVLHGQFTLRGITRPLSFPVVIAASDGLRITGQAQFELDRTQFGSVPSARRYISCRAGASGSLGRGFSFAVKYLMPTRLVVRHQVQFDQPLQIRQRCGVFRRAPK